MVSKSYPHFPIYEGDLNQVFAPIGDSDCDFSGQLAAQKIEIHDWVDHCLFGRTLTFPGDTCPAFDLKPLKKTNQDLATFVALNRERFQAWRQQSPEARPAFQSVLQCFPNDIDLAGYEVLTETEMSLLVDVLDQKTRAFQASDENPADQALTRERRKKAVQAEDSLEAVNRIVEKRNLGHHVFLAEYEGILAPWVHSYLDALIHDTPIPAIPDEVTHKLSRLSEMRHHEPDRFESYDEEQLRRVRRELGQTKQGIYTKAEILAQRFAGSPEKRAELIDTIREIRAEKS